MQLPLYGYVSLKNDTPVDRYVPTIHRDCSIGIAALANWQLATGHGTLLSH